MILKGGINNIENGMTASLRAMHLQTAILSVYTQNVIGFDKIGYQRKEPVVSSFSEYIGTQGLSTAVDDTVGRITQSNNPLDLAITQKGYFQYLSNDGIELSRDGRLKVTKEGELVSLNNNKILGTDGNPIKLPIMPEKLEDISIDKNGKVNIFSPKYNRNIYAGTVSVVSQDNVAVVNPDIKQGYTEYSNVALQEEFMGALPLIKNFDANRQMFLINSNNLSTAISKLSQ